MKFMAFRTVSKVTSVFTNRSLDTDVQKVSSFFFEMLSLHVNQGIFEKIKILTFSFQTKSKQKLLSSVPQGLARCFVCRLCLSP